MYIRLVIECQTILLVSSDVAKFDNWKLQMKGKLVNRGVFLQLNAKKLVRKSTQGSIKCVQTLYTTVEIP